MKSTVLLNYATEAGINLRKMMKMGWILVVVRGLHVFYCNVPFHIVPGKPPAGIGVKRNGTAARPAGVAGRETTLQAGRPFQHRDPAQGQGIPP